MTAGKLRFMMFSKVVLNLVMAHYYLSKKGGSYGGKYYSNK